MKSPKKINKFLPVSRAKYQKLMDEKKELTALNAWRQNEIEIRDKAIRARDRQIKRDSSYQAWLANHKIGKQSLDLQIKAQSKFKYRPLISLIIPTYNSSRRLLQQCLNSIYHQTYDNWEICLVDDASTLDGTKRCIETNSAKNDKLKVHFRDKNGQMVAASNQAIAQAGGEFIAIVDHEDKLEPNALFAVAELLNKTPYDLIYTDSDSITDDNLRFDPLLKPDWSPEYLLSQNYIQHLTVIRKKLIDEVGGFRSGTEGAQDWDLYLRISEKTSKIGHLPQILYHWRANQGLMESEASHRGNLIDNQERVVKAAISRRKQSVVIKKSPQFGTWWPKYEVKGTPLVSIIIPTKDHLTVLQKCLESIVSRTTYPNYEIIIVDTGSTESSIKDFYVSFAKHHSGFQVFSWSGQFNFPEVCNFGAKNARGAFLLFLNNDTEVITQDWLQSLLGYAQREDIGMVGCKLRYPNGFIQHCGVGLGIGGVSGHILPKYEEGTDKFAEDFVQPVRDLSAVTAACSLVDHQKFDRVGGFDPRLRINFNDIDLCLKLLKKCWRNVYLPFVELYHHESLSVGPDSSHGGPELKQAITFMKKHWGQLLMNDPYLNPNFSLNDGQLYLRRPEEKHL